MPAMQKATRPERKSRYGKLFCSLAAPIRTVTMLTLNPPIVETPVQNAYGWFFLLKRRMKTELRPALF